MRYLHFYLDRLDEAVNRPSILRSWADSAMIFSGWVLALVCMLVVIYVCCLITDAWCKWQLKRHRPPAPPQKRPRC